MPRLSTRATTPLPAFAPGTARRATLDAAFRRLLPPDADARTVAAVSATAVEKLALLPDEKRADFARGVDAMGSRFAALAATGRPLPFDRLPSALQDRMLAAWEHSPVPLLRTAFQAVRRLALALHYATPEAHARIGYLGPLHEREVAFAWEGPVPRAASGAAHDDGPVARTGADAGADAGARAGAHP